MRKIILAALAVVLLGSTALAPPAEARCWWNGYGWHCWHPHAWWWRRHHYWNGYAWYGYPHYWRYY
jgi:hypothetical protein